MWSKILNSVAAGRRADVELARGDRHASGRVDVGRSLALNVKNRSYQCSLAVKNFAKTVNFAGGNAWVALEAAYAYSYAFGEPAC